MNNLKKTKTFKQYFTEKTHPPVDNWKELLDSNDMLKTGFSLVKKLEKLGGEALIVGGSVRDILLGKDPKDVDIATNVPMPVIKQNFKWNDIGESDKFGITLVHYGGHEFEVANYRKEEGSKDSRHPDKVEMVKSFEEDAARRDITINSMGINSKGEIVDYHGGIDDLKKGIIRSVGKARERFLEDALRIIRAVRFSARFGFKIDDETRADMKGLNFMINDLSKERVRDELLKVSKDGKKLADYIEGLDDNNLLEVILPELKELQGKKQNPKHHPEGDAYEHTLAAVRHTRSNNPTTNLAILFHDLGKGTVEIGDKDGHPTYHGHDNESARLVRDVGIRLRLPNKVTDALEYSAINHMKTHYINDMSKKKVVQLVLDPNWEILKDVVYADELSRGDIDKGGLEEFEEKIMNAEKIASEFSQGKGRSQVTKRIKEKIDGNMIMNWTGLRQGVELGDILNQTQDWLYNNIDATEDEIKEYVMKLYDDLKPKSLEECYRIINEQHKI